MVPLYLLVGAGLAFRALGALGLERLKSPRVCVRLALVLMFTFTGVTHFTSMRHDYVRMVPPLVPAPMLVVYATGALELLGAVGLLVPRLRRPAALGLALLLIAIFPANVYAHLEEVTFRGAPATSIWLRAPIQLVYLVAVWYAGLRRPVTPAGAVPRERADLGD